ncbi:MAG: Oligopeptide transport system permease protein OppC [Synergistaceae bacterium]|jgi:peptide/nickel transport system permease protein
MMDQKSLISKIIKSEGLYNFKRNPFAIAGALIILVFLLTAIFGPHMVSQNPYDLAQLDLNDSYKPPIWQEGSDPRFILGTDDQGRDMVSAIVYGVRMSVTIGFCVTIICMIAGTTLGLISGYKGGRLDSFIMGLVNVQLSFPSLLIAMLVLIAFGRGVWKIILALAFSGWVTYARTVRGTTMAEKGKEYVEAAKVIGFPERVILFKHILPNVMTPVIVIATLQIGTVILSEATLSFLGIGIPITEPSLGLLVAQGYIVLFSGLWWVSVFPGLVLMLLVVGMNLLGDFLRDEFNPRLK